MNELIIDTSSNLLYVGLLKDKKSDFLTRVGKNDNSAFVIDLIDQLLKKHDLTINNINRIIVGIGPGSYTGARVAVVVAKTLAYAKDIKLATISSLNLLSSGYTGVITPVIDARRKHYFIGSYSNGKTITNDSYQEILNLDDSYILLDIETIKVNNEIVSLNSLDVTNIHDLEPNYLRKTEAENNYDKINDNNWYYISC